MSKRSLITYLYYNFQKVGLVSSKNEFSQKYLLKSMHYYKNTVKIGRDLPLNAAIDCLIQVRKRLKKFREKRSEIGSINDDKIVVLEDAEIKLWEYLRVKYRVADIVEEVETIYDQEDYYGVMIT